MGRDERLGAGEEVIEDPENQPVLHFLPLGIHVEGPGLPEVMKLRLCLEGHHCGDALPGHEQRAGHSPAGRGLPPSGQDERPQEGTHGANAMRGVRRHDRRAGGDDRRGTGGITLLGD